VYISFNAAEDSLQLATENVYRKFLASIRAKLLQPVNIKLKFVLDVTAVVTKAGTDVREVQL